jgi:hypothetical protein
VPHISYVCIHLFVIVVSEASEGASGSSGVKRLALTEQLRVPCDGPTCPIVWHHRSPKGAGIREVL